MDMNWSLDSSVPHVSRRHCNAEAQPLAGSWSGCLAHLASYLCKQGGERLCVALSIHILRIYQVTEVKHKEILHEGKGPTK